MTQPSKALTPQEQKFDKHITALIEVAKEVHDKEHGPMSGMTLWMTRLTRLQTSYIKSKNPMGWAEMFSKFYAVHSDAIAKDIFVETDEDTKINDDWLKITENFETRGLPPGGSGWGPRQASCKGYVLYFDTDPRARWCSIAINEIYQTAVKLSKEQGGANTRIFAYPAQILYNFYEILAVVVSPFDETHKTLVKNALILREFINEISPTDPSADGIGEGVKGFSKIMASVMKAAGIGTEANAAELESAMQKSLEGDTVKTMGKVVSKIMESVGSIGGADGPGDTDTVMDRLGDVFKDKEIREMLSTSAKATADQVAGLAASIPHAGEDPSAPPSAPAPAPAPPRDEGAGGAGGAEGEVDPKDQE